MRRAAGVLVCVVLLAACGQRPGAHVVAARTPIAAVSPTSPALVVPSETAADTAASESTDPPAPIDPQVADTSGGSDERRTAGDRAEPPNTQQTGKPAAPVHAESTAPPEAEGSDHGAPLWDRQFRSERVTEAGRERALVGDTSIELAFQRNRPNDGDPADNLNWYDTTIELRELRERK